MAEAVLTGKRRGLVNGLRWLNTLYLHVGDRAEKWLPLITVAAFVVGIFLAKYFPGFSNGVNHAVASFIDGYSVVAPVAIFFILSPCLAKLLSIGRAGRFGAYAIGWLAVRRLFACLWAVAFTAVVFHFPLLPEQHQGSLLSALGESMKSFVWMATHNSYFFAIYVGVAASFVSLRVVWVRKLLNNALALIENAGQYFQVLVPFFMLAVGAYIYGLPSNLEEQLQATQGILQIGQVDFLGIKINPHTPSDFILVYVLGSFLVAIACFCWHSALVGLAKLKIEGFSIRDYFLKYWIKVYPILWATSSETLATPLNLHLTKMHFPQIKDEVRSLVVGMGSYLNINGTLICVFVLLGVVVNLMGFRLSVLELLFCIPIVFLIGYGVPGIPGELILFAGPIATLLNLPPEIFPGFIALYSGLQLGLPDSFRTGNNSTDDGLCALLLNDVYQKRYLKEGEDELGTRPLAGVQRRTGSPDDQTVHSGADAEGIPYGDGVSAGADGAGSQRA